MADSTGVKFTIFAGWGRERRRGGGRGTEKAGGGEGGRWRVIADEPFRLTWQRSQFAGANSISSATNDMMKLHTSSSANQR